VDQETDVEVEKGFFIRFLQGRGYQRNLSLARVLDHRQAARRFIKRAESELPPDIIICSYPTIELAGAGVKLGRDRNAPVVIDIRDLWPDIFPYYFPVPLRPLLRIALEPMFIQSKRALRRASAIIGITDDFVEWGARRAGRPRRRLDRFFPFVYPRQELSHEEIKEAERYWDDLKVWNDKFVFTIIFIGTLGKSYDQEGKMETIIRASCILGERGVDHQVVLAGEGECKEKYIKLVKEAGAKVSLPGWQGRTRLHVLMRRAHVGLDPLPNRFDFLGTINNKAVEYLSAGLPVVSSPRKGTLYRLLQRHKCGMSYDVGDAEGLANLLEGLAKDRERLREMSQNALRMYQEVFAYEKVTAEFEAYLKEAVNWARGRKG